MLLMLELLRENQNSDGLMVLDIRPILIFFFWRAIVKYGWDGFTHNILHSNLSKEEALSIKVYTLNGELISICESIHEVS